MSAFLSPTSLPLRRAPTASTSPRRPPTASADATTLSRAQDVISDLVKANARYAAGEPAPQTSTPAIREHLATNGQFPQAAVIACADSRVAPELIFGAGLGQVFVVRNAGNVAWGDSVVGSLEYAVDALNVPLVVVLGHTKCGAVGAAVETAKKGVGGAGPLMNHVGRIAEVVKGEVGKPDEVGRAVEKNVRDGVTALLKGDTAVAKYAQNGDIKVVGMVYDIMTGIVSVLD